MPTRTILSTFRQLDFEAAMQDVYDFLHDINSHLIGKGLPRMDDTLRKATMSGTLSDMLTASIQPAFSQHGEAQPESCREWSAQRPPGSPGWGRVQRRLSRRWRRGCGDKTALKRGGAFDTQGARNQWLCVFVYEVDRVTQPATERSALTFREVYLSKVTISHFTARARKTDIGTRTANIAGAGLVRFRSNWIYKSV